MPGAAATKALALGIGIAGITAVIAAQNSLEGSLAVAATLLLAGALGVVAAVTAGLAGGLGAVPRGRGQLVWQISN